MQRIAIIDIGSNSARLVISHIYKNGAYNMVYNQKEALRLSQKVDGQNLLTEENNFQFIAQESSSNSLLLHLLKRMKKVE